MRKQATYAVKRAVLVAAVFGSGFVLTHNASADDRPNRYTATVVCASMAEDSAAHVRLVRYDHNADGTYTLVYRCRHNGY